MTLWLTMLAMGLVTYIQRLSLIGLLGKAEVPPWLRRALRLVAPAVLSAIVFPALLRPEGVLDVSLGNARLLAGLAAALVAWRTRSVMATVAVGMLVLWGLQYAA